MLQGLADVAGPTVLQGLEVIAGPALLQGLAVHTPECGDTAGRMGLKSMGLKSRGKRWEPEGAALRANLNMLPLRERKCFGKSGDWGIAWRSQGQNGGKIGHHSHREHGDHTSHGAQPTWPPNRPPNNRLGVIQRKMKILTTAGVWKVVGYQFATGHDGTGAHGTWPSKPQLSGWQKSPIIPAKQAPSEAGCSTERSRIQLATSPRWGALLACYWARSATYFIYIVVLDHTSHQKQRLWCMMWR